MPVSGLSYRSGHTFWFAPELVSVDDTVEVAVLGKGVGESIVLRLDDKWVIVDSFKERSANGRFRPAPLQYLEDRGVNAATDVRSVVLTHLHADHSEGIDEVVATCRRARFYMPSAVPGREWNAVLNELARDSSAPRRRKMQQIANAFRAAWDDDRFQAVGATSVISTGSLELYAIGPTVRAENAVTTPGVLMGPGAVVRENFTSIVLWLCAGNAAALLCADMDCDDQFGWRSLLEEQASSAWLRGAKLVKVSHHGSRRAHEPDVFSSWTDRPVAVITPNRANDLPAPEVVEELKQLCFSVWLANAHGDVPLRASSSVSNSTTVAIAISGSRTTGEWTVVADPAYRL